MSNAAKILPHYTYQEYQHWEGKWEVIEGIPYAMSPAPTPRHQIVSTNLLLAFGIQLQNCKQCMVMQPVDYVVADDIIIQPDLLIVCKPIEKKFLDFPPTLVVEVLSPSTALKDRHSKYEIYQSQGVKYYIIIDPDKNEAEVFELNSGEYKMTAKGMDFSHSFSFEDCNAAIEFKEIWK